MTALSQAAQEQRDLQTEDSCIRLTAAQALIRYLLAQKTELLDGSICPLFAGLWGIYGHGNVAGIGEALYAQQAALPYFRGQNEQGMAHAAIAYAKAQQGRRLMAVSTSIGPGATNLVTAAALAHVNRLPVLFIPGDVFASRRPDPVLQQLEAPSSPLLTANSSLEPVSRYYDVVSRPEQILSSLPRAIQTMLDPQTRGPATLGFCQDVQVEAFDYPRRFFEETVHYLHRPEPDPRQLERCAALLRAAKRPLIIAGGGVHYSGAQDALEAFVRQTGIPVAETQAGKGALLADNPLNLGGIGVTGTQMANDWAREADLVLCVGTRLSDFTTASKSLFSNERCRFVGLNTVTLDAYKLSAEALVADAQRGLGALKEALEGQEWTEAHARLRQRRQQWAAVQAGVYAEEGERPSDAQVLMALNAFCSSNATVVCAAGGLPGELHRHWNCKDRAAYHVEYGYSCMGYEIAGGLGLKLAQPEREVYVLVGDGSYLMLHTELHTAVSLGQKISVIVLDNQGFGCINRLQKGSAGAPYGNLREGPRVDFVANARSYGCFAEEVSNLAELQAALKRQQSIQDRPCVTVIQSDPQRSSEGYAWWDVPVAEVSTDAAVNEARKAYQVERARLQGRC